MPRLERGRARAAALLAAGAATFADKGYDAATMTEIAARAGASIGSLYQFFPTKELLADALHGEQLEALSRMLKAVGATAAGRPAASLADALFAELADFLDRHPAFVALAERRAADKARKRENRGRLRGQIASLLTGAVPPVPPERAALLAIVILQLMKAMVALGGSEDAATRDAVRAELRRMLRTHLGGTAS